MPKAELFQKDVRTVNEHIKNIYLEKELNKIPTIRKFRIVQKEGKRAIERSVDCYNLDIIISVGYRIKSLRGTQFRIWATNVLRKHLMDGYTINEKRLKTRSSLRGMTMTKRAQRMQGNLVSFAFTFLHFTFHVIIVDTAKTGGYTSKP